MNSPLHSYSICTDRKLIFTIHNLSQLWMYIDLFSSICFSVRQKKKDDKPNFDGVNGIIHCIRTSCEFPEKQFSLQNKINTSCFGEKQCVFKLFYWIVHHVDIWLQIPSNAILKGCGEAIPQKRNQFFISIYCHWRIPYPTKTEIEKHIYLFHSLYLKSRWNVFCIESLTSDLR